MTSLFREYKASLKSMVVEEFLDLFFFRPIAFLLVKLLYRFPITPNQISVTAMIVGVIGGIVFAFGTPQALFWGAFLYGSANVIDCSDGMIARLKHNGTKTGRIIDGAVDYVVSFFVYNGMGLGLTLQAASYGLEFPAHPWLIVFFSGVSTAIHSGITDNVRNAYETFVNGKKILPQLEYDEFQEELKRLEGVEGEGLNRFIIRAYLRYTKFQLGNNTAAVYYQPDEYKRYNRFMVPLWNLIGPTTHIAVFMIAGFLYQPEIFFWYALVFSNIWMIVMGIIQYFVNKNLTPFSTAQPRVSQQ